MSEVVETTGNGVAPAPAETVGAPPAPKEKTVAYDVFQRVVEARAGLEGQVRDLKAQVQSLTERASEAESRYGAYTELSGVLGSTDPDIIGAFDSRWRSLPEADRPDRKAWVESLRAAPEAAPALLRPWLGGQAQGAITRSPPVPAPRAPATGATPPGAPSSYSAEEIARVREEAVRSGDWSKWRDMRKSMGLAR